ncbi:hypothetical protein LCGC14_3036690, partial [marine sediment metagenome]
RTTQMDAHASLTATSIHASLIVTDTAVKGRALVVQGDGTADWALTDAHAALTTTSLTSALITTGSAAHGLSLVVQGDGTADWSAATMDKVSIAFIVNGGTSVITPGVKGFLEVPFDCNIDQATVLANQSGDLVVDVWKDTFANFPPTNADTITGGSEPTISSAQSSQDSTLSGWTTGILAGDIVGFNVDSILNVHRATISLRCAR